MFRNYTPNSFSELTFEDATVESRLKKYAQGFKRKSLLLYGEPGTAKSLTAQIIAREVSNLPSNNRAFSTDRATVINGDDWNKKSEILITNTWCHSSPYVVVDEVDELGKSQKTLTKLIDEWAEFGSFILTTNQHPNQLLQRLVSRCEVMKVDAISEAKVFPIVRHIFDCEGLEHYSNAQIKTLIKTTQINGRSSWRAVEDMVDDEIFYVRNEKACA